MSFTHLPRGTRASGLPSRPSRIAPPRRSTSRYTADDLVLGLLLVLSLVMIANALAVEGRIAATHHHGTVRAPMEIAAGSLPAKGANLNEPQLTPKEKGALRAIVVDLVTWLSKNDLR